MTHSNEHKLYQTIQRSPGHQNPAGLSGQCDGYTANPHETGPRFLNCTKPATVRFTIQDDLGEQRDVKRCRHHAQMVRFQASLGWSKILEEQIIEA